MAASLVIPACVATMCFYWSADSWKRHPLAILLSQFNRPWMYVFRVRGCGLILVLFVGNLNDFIIGVKSYMRVTSSRYSCMVHCFHVSPCWCAVQIKCCLHPVRWLHQSTLSSEVWTSLSPVRMGVVRN